MLEIVGLVVCAYVAIGAAIAAYHFSNTPPHTRSQQALTGWLAVALLWPKFGL
jgi:hypothetical protein